MPKRRERKPPEAKGRGKKKQEPSDGAAVRGMWSGTISFGLVSVPVALYPALRPRPIRLRQFDADGTPLKRQYVCPADHQVMGEGDIVRGFEHSRDEYIVVEDEELEALEPERSHDINLLEFVDVAEIDPFFFDHPYFLAPALGSYKAYRLLAEVMAERHKAGIATFVMREREYLVAILAEHGLLMAETLRFADLLRTPEQLELTVADAADPTRKQAFRKAIAAASGRSVPQQALRDAYAERLNSLVQRKRKQQQAVVKTGEAESAEPGEAVDLVAVFKQRMAEAA